MKVDIFFNCFFFRREVYSQGCEVGLSLLVSHVSSIMIHRNSYIWGMSSSLVHVQSVLFTFNGGGTEARKEVGN